MSDYRISEKSLPPGFKYPDAFSRVVSQGLTNLTPWHILDSDAGARRLEGLRKRFPNRLYVPFARRQDNDDLAVWDAASDDERVLIVHDFSSNGSEERDRVQFWDWLRRAIDEMIEFEP